MRYPKKKGFRGLTKHGKIKCKTTLPGEEVLDCMCVSNSNTVLFFRDVLYNLIYNLSMRNNAFVQPSFYRDVLYYEYFFTKINKALCTLTCLKRTAPKGEPHSCVAAGTDGTGGKDDPVGKRNEDPTRRGVVELTRRKRLNMARQFFRTQKDQEKGNVEE